MAGAMGEIGLKAGWHPIRVEHFDAGGAMGLEAAWRGPGVAQQPIPPAALGRL